MPLDHLALVLSLFLALDHSVDVVIQIFFLLDIRRVLDNLVVIDVESAQIHLKRSLTVQSFLQILLNLVIQKSVDWVVEEIVPVNSFLRVNDEHLSENIFRFLGDIINFLRNIQWLILNSLYELNHVCGSEGRLPE